MHAINYNTVVVYNSKKNEISDSEREKNGITLTVFTPSVTENKDIYIEQLFFTEAAETGKPTVMMIIHN